MRSRFLIPAAVGAALTISGFVPAMAGAAAGQPGAESGNRSFTMAVYGDAPYGVTKDDTAQTLATPAFIDDVNADPDVSTDAGVCWYDAWRSHPSYDVSNFHRVIVHGSTFPLEWLKLTVTPGAHAPTTSTSFGPFTWQRMPVN